MKKVINELRRTTKKERVIYDNAIEYFYILKKEGKKAIPYSLIAKESFRTFKICVKAARALGMYIRRDEN